MMSLPDFKEKQIVFVLISRGDKLSFKNDNIIVKNCDDEIIHQSTCYKLFAVYLVGHVTVTSGLLQRVEKFGFTLVFMTHNLRVYGIWAGKTEGNFLLRKKQYSYQSLDIARYIVQNKIKNQMKVLKKIRVKDNSIHNKINILDKFNNALSAPDLELKSILGYEGIASREYFKILFQGHNWKGRRPRVKECPINSLQDTGYTMLFNLVEGLLNLYGFDVYKGVYHQCFYQRKSLVCDLVEPFRVIVDTCIKRACALGQVKEDDFYFVNKQYRLFGKKAIPYLQFLLKDILKYKCDMFDYAQKYYRCFIRERTISEFPVFEI